MRVRVGVRVGVRIRVGVRSRVRVRIGVGVRVSDRNGGCGPWALRQLSSVSRRCGLISCRVSLSSRF